MRGPAAVGRGVDAAGSSRPASQSPGASDTAAAGQPDAIDRMINAHWKGREAGMLYALDRILELHGRFLLAHPPAQSRQAKRRREWRKRAAAVKAERRRR